MEDLSTRDKEYAERLHRLQSVWWKKLLDVQAPYRWNLKRLSPGRTLDIGCGIGRNVKALGANSVGIDHNPHSIEIARKQGLNAFLPEDFKKTAQPRSFDSLLLSHLVEHMTFKENIDLLNEYIPYLKNDGLEKIIIIAPQEVGFRSDSTHVEFMNFEKISALVEAVGFHLQRSYSFPFPRALGKLFIYNEFITVSKRTLTA